jgi:IS30 family transposase
MKHLTVKQRYTISVMLQKGYTQKQIAEAIGKHKSTVCREIRRNCDARSGAYRYELYNVSAKKDTKLNLKKFVLQSK